MIRDKRRVLFRADGGPSIGMGHIVRALALAEMLSDRFYKIFVTREPGDSVRKMIEAQCDELIVIKTDSDHFEDFLTVLKGDEIVVLDNYFYDAEFQIAIKRKGCRLVCIDDMHNKHYAADIVINHSPGLRKDMFSFEHYTRIYLGLDFAMLRKPFLDAAKSEIEIEKTNSLFVCFGGSDPGKLTIKVLEAIMGIGTIDRIKVVTGPQFNGKRSMEKIVAQHNSIDLFTNIDSERMVEVLKQCRLAIVPASTVLLEALSLRMPAITGYYIDNQLDFEHYFKGVEGIVSIGDFREVKPATISEVLEGLLSDFRPLKGVLIDGLSDERIERIFSNL